MKREIIIPIITAIVASLITAFFQPHITNIIETTKIPIISKEIKTQQDVLSLPSNVLSQIKNIKTQYILKHYSGGTGTNLTIILKSDKIIKFENLKITMDSEKTAYKKEINNKRIEINIPKLRPKEKILLEITHPTNITLEWSELIETGEVHNIIDIKKNNNFNREDKLVIFVLVIFVLIIGGVLFFIFEVAEKFMEIEDLNREMSINSKKVILLVLLLISFGNTVVKYLNIPFPIVPINDIFFVILTYLVITNMTSIKNKYFI